MFFRRFSFHIFLENLSRPTTHNLKIWSGRVISSVKKYERTIYRQTQPPDHSTGDRLRNYSTFRERERLGRPQWNREHLCGRNKDFAPGKSDNATIFNCMMQLKITLGTAGRRLSLQKGQDYECCIQQGPANLLWAERGKNSAKVLSRVRNELFKRIILDFIITCRILLRY